MPTYQYQCQNCSHEFEEFQTISEEPLKQCPRCGGSVRRLISGGAGLLFKGSGFYITDYRSEKYKADAKKEKTDPGSASPEKKPEAKSTTKTERKSA